MSVGLAVIAPILVGVIGLVVAVVAWSKQDWGGGGLCLIASAVAFGSVLRAVTR